MSVLDVLSVDERLVPAREADAGRRIGMEAGMAKLFGSETAMELARGGPDG